MKYFLIITLLCTPALATSSYKAKCAACHGGEGQGVSGYAPKLAGQFAFYLKNQIRDIKNGKRTNGMSTSMKPIFENMTEKEVEEMCNWLEGLK